jgi:peptidoglycan hydrolase FlgJ
VSDISSLKKKFSLQNDPHPVTKEKLKEVADMYEKHFLKEMMKQMKSASFGDDDGLFKKNHAEKIFQEQLDDEYSSQWNKTGSFGLSDMIYKQLIDRYGSKLGLNQQLEKPKGPVDLNQKHEIEKIKNESGQGVSFKIRNLQTGNGQSIKNPWAGTLQSKHLMDNDNSVYKIKHDNGLESLISVRGAASEKSRFLSVNDILPAGQELARADNSSPLFWTVGLNKKS